jgi:DNA-binding MarR family transcriptional regulator
MDHYSNILTDIRKIVRSINLESKRIQKEFGISIPQLLCLTFLSKCEEYQSTHRELTRFLHLNSSTVTGIINRLEKKGYIARLPKRDDKRMTYVSLTSAGYRVLENTPDLLHEKLAGKLKNLPLEKVEAIQESLNHIIAALGIEDMDASPMLTMEEPITPEEAENGM